MQHFGVAFYWITGLPGSGKTTVLSELAHRGFEAHNGDDFSCWFDSRTGLAVEDLARQDRSLDWFDRMTWRIDVTKVRALAIAALHRPTFVGGVIFNEDEIWPLFDKHVYLAADDAALRRRLVDRTNNGYGKDPRELEALLAWNRTAVAEYRALGATIIDAARSVDEVVAAVLTATVGSPNGI